MRTPRGFEPVAGRMWASRRLRGSGSAICVILAEARCARPPCLARPETSTSLSSPLASAPPLIACRPSEPPRIYAEFGPSMLLIPV